MPDENGPSMLPLPSEPLFRFGVITDVQYCDIPDSFSYFGVRRHYRGSLDCLRAAAEEWGRRRDLAFIAQLGDLLDGKCQDLGHRDAALDLVMRPLRHAGTPRVFHCIGNHELYNFTRAELREVLATAPAAGEHEGVRGTGHEYYSFRPAPGWRCVVLDPYQQAIIGHDPDTPTYQEALKALQANNPNDVLRSNTPWSKGLAGLARRWMPYNGALGAPQLAWLRAEGRRAHAAGERVIVLSHCPLHPGPSAYDVVWDFTEALAVLREAGNVVAVLSGHAHPGGYALDDSGIHHVVFPSPLNCGSADLCHGLVEVFPDRLEVLGAGIVPSRSLAVA